MFNTLPHDIYSGVQGQSPPKVHGQRPMHFKRLPITLLQDQDQTTPRPTIRGTLTGHQPPRIQQRSSQAHLSSHSTNRALLSTPLSHPSASRSDWMTYS